jgi:AcrR family transcriptional regulator
MLMEQKSKKKVIDRRIQRTRQLLRDSLNVLILEKGYEAITVQDVLDRANVGRSTFYAHFQDKEDLLLNGVETLWEQLEQHLLADSVVEEDIWNVSQSMFQHAQSQQSLYKALAGKQGGGIALKHIERNLYQLVYRHLKIEMLKRQSTFPTEILAKHLVNSFITLLTWWLDSDATFTAEQMNAFYQLLVGCTVETILLS